MSGKRDRTKTVPEIMIEALDKSIAAFLGAELPAEIGSRLAISFAPLGDQFPPSTLALPAVNLFLYRMEESASLRDQSPVLQRLANGFAQKTRPPVYLDCSYLVTIWPDPKGSDPTEEEHAILGAVAKVLLAHAVLPSDSLQGAMQTTQTAPVAAKLSTGTFTSPTDLWQALGGRPKLTLNYTVTFSMPVYEPEESPLVTENQIRFRVLATGGSE